MTRRILVPRALALLFALALLAAGCGGGDDEPPIDTDTSATVDDRPLEPCDDSIDAITVTGDAGAKPTLEFDEPLSVEETECEVRVEGEGATIVDGDRVVFDVLLVNGRTKVEYGSSYGQTSASSFVVDDQIIRGVRQGIVGQTVGSRVVVAIAPQDAFGETGDAAAGLEGDDTLVGVVDLHEVIDALERAEGTPVTPPAGLPEVTLGGDGAPTIEPPATEPPTDLVVQRLIEGTGPVVTAGQTIIAHYHGVIWATSEIFGSSWQEGRPDEFVIGAQQVIAGWDNGIVGQPVGSQVLLIVPPKDGYGAEGRPGPDGQGGIAGTDTLVFVVDILAALG